MKYLSFLLVLAASQPGADLSNKFLIRSPRPEST
jgi:hypothetical protein